MSEFELPDYYAVLEVASHARQSVIEGAYEALVLEDHPEQGGGLEAIEEAYEVLSDPDLRAEYDEERAGRPAEPDPEPDGTMDEADIAYHEQVAALESQLAVDPTNYAGLVSLGNAYFDWAYAKQQSEQSKDGADRPLWAAAADVYARALTVNGESSPVRVDHAIATFSSGKIKKATRLAEAVAKDDPEFGPAQFNLGVFYEAAGRPAEALAAYERYLELLPADASGGNAEYARQQIAELQAQ